MDPIIDGFKQQSLLDGYWAPLATGVLALVVSLLATPWAAKLAYRFGAIDDPKSDARRIHAKPTPRWGGLAIFAGIVVALLATLPLAYPFRPYPPYLIAILLGAAAIVGLGMLDDKKGLSAKWQMLYICAVAVGVQFAFDQVGRVQVQGISWPPFSAEGSWVPFGWLAIPLTMAYIFVITKTTDTIDGIDGLASGIAGIAGSTLAIIAVMDGQPRVAIIAAAVAGASLGFLPHNYNPARIFMGTGGAQVLGFMLACLSIVGAFKTVATAVTMLVPVLVFGVPLIDAVNVIVRRLWHRQPIAQADKRHLHHTLLDFGLNQKQVVWVLYGITAALCGILLVMVRLYGAA